MKYLKLILIAIGFVGFMACNSGDSSTNGEQSTEQSSEKDGKTKVTIDTEKGEAGFENEDVDVKVKTDDKDKK